MQGLKEIDKQIQSLGADPLTGEFVDNSSGNGSFKESTATPATEEVSEYDARINKINENNRRKTKEAMAAAHAASLARKKAEDAIVKAKTKLVYSYEMLLEID